MTRPPGGKKVPGERLRLNRAERIMAHSPSWRTRGARLVLLALALSLVLFTSWSSNLPAQHRASGEIPPSISLPILLMSNLPNATIILNGKHLAGHLPQVVTADLEADEVTITAPLFRTHTCHFKGLVTTDPAHCLFTIEDSFGGAVHLFTFGVCLTLDDLLPAAREQFLSPPTQRATVLQTTVQPDDSIATAFGTTDVPIASQRANRPLQASALLAQAEPHASRSFSCEQILTEPLATHQQFPARAPAGYVWGLLLNLVPRWRFIDPSGTPISDVTYRPGSVDDTFMSYLQFTYDATGWQLLADPVLESEIPSILCAAGEHMLQIRLRNDPTEGNMEILSNRGGEGCLIVILPDVCKGCVPPDQADPGTGRFLWRFGVLLAANAQAHTMLPDLPLASQAAIKAVSG